MQDGSRSRGGGAGGALALFVIASLIWGLTPVIGFVVAVIGFVAVAVLILLGLGVVALIFYYMFATDFMDSVEHWLTLTLKGIFKRSWPLGILVAYVMMIVHALCGVMLVILPVVVLAWAVVFFSWFFV